MKINRNFIIIGVFAIVLATLSCMTNADSHQLSPDANTSSVFELSPTVVSTPETKVNSPIRTIDFENFTFPETNGEEFGGLGPTKLVGGKNTQTGATLGEIEYGDVTNDGMEEALVAIDPYDGGNTSADIVFVYTVIKSKPKLLWSFESGDRAEGGRKRVYAENGDLIVELFGDNKYDNGKWDYDIAEGKFNGLCCPTTYTRFHFHWNGKKFVLKGEPELFDYDWREQTNRKE
ncbi:MAG: hypothetical protein ACKVRN_10995 [Pyrinomonadaceae bacterium]